MIKIVTFLGAFAYIFRLWPTKILDAHFETLRATRVLIIEMHSLPVCGPRGANLTKQSP
jgi:hypothetical protein